MRTLVLTAQSGGITRITLLDAQGEEVTCMFRKANQPFKFDGTADITRVYLNFSYRIYEEAVDTLCEDIYPSTH